MNAPLMVNYCTVVDKRPDNDMNNNLVRVETHKALRVIWNVVLCIMMTSLSGCLSYSHYRYSKRAEAARALPEGMVAKPGRIYFASFPENCLALSIWGWHPNVGHASLVTNDKSGTIRQYDYGWFVGHEGGRPTDAIGYVDESESYGVVRRKSLPAKDVANATNDLEVARMVLTDMPTNYGGKVELWAKDVNDIGIAERYMEQLAEDKDRGSMAWRCWQIGGYRCGNITRQAFDAARGEGHFLDLLLGRIPRC